MVAVYTARQCQVSLSYDAQTHLRSVKKMISPKLLTTILMAVLTNSADASSDPGTANIAWANKSEVLSYRSCGCADSCWVAELRERTSKKLKARLRCDCATLFARYPANSGERELPGSCSAINEQNDKMAAIAQTMKRLVARQIP